MKEKVQLQAWHLSPLSLDQPTSPLTCCSQPGLRHTGVCEHHLPKTEGAQHVLQDSKVLGPPVSKAWPSRRQTAATTVPEPSQQVTHPSSDPGTQPVLSEGYLGFT